MPGCSTAIATRVEPTPVGQRLIERARLLVNQARDIEQDLRQMLGLEVGLLRIGAGPYPADLSVGTALGRFVKDHPQILRWILRWQTGRH